jgi:sugar phosphate isomerase/epimerase
MKLGISMYSYVAAVKDGRLDLPGFIREAKRIGADGVELLDFFYNDADSERVIAKETLEETGLPCGVFSIANNFAQIEAADRDAELKKIEFGIGEACYFGTDVVRVFAGDVSEGITFDDARSWIIEGLTKGANLAHERGVKLALENHGRLAGKGEQIRGLIDAVRQNCGHDALGANPDTGNFILACQESHEAIKQVADYAYMVHFKDFAPAPARSTDKQVEDYSYMLDSEDSAPAPDDWEGGYRDLEDNRFYGTVVGEGMVDLAQCLQALKDAGFTGWVNLEWEGAGDPFVDVPKSLEYERNFLSALA